jgi:hypothetical protein
VTNCAHESAELFDRVALALPDVAVLDVRWQPGRRDGHERFLAGHAGRGVRRPRSDRRPDNITIEASRRGELSAAATTAAGRRPREHAIATLRPLAHKDPMVRVTYGNSLSVGATHLRSTSRGRSLFA